MKKWNPALVFFLLLWSVLAASCAPGATPAPTAAPALTAAPRPSATLPVAPTRPLTSPTGGSTPATLGGSTPAAVLSLKGRFTYAPGDGSLWVQDATGANARVIVKPSAQTFAESPSFSPDGKQIVFAMSTLTKDGLVNKDLRLVNADGTGARVLLSPEYPKIAFSFPSWSQDGKEVYFTQAYPIPPASEHAEIDRIGAAGGGAPKALVGDGRAGSVSPDGKRVAFQRFDFKTFTASLWVSNVDGSGAKLLLDNSVFLGIIGPRFSPDSKSILFSASGPPQKKLPGYTGYLSPTRFTEGRENCLFDLLGVCVLQTAHADGLPWDLWVVDAEGTKFEQMTRVGSDSPYPTWSPDGKYVAFFDVSGIYVVDRETKTIYPVTESGGHGGFDWR